MGGGPSPAGEAPPLPVRGPEGGDSPRQYGPPLPPHFAGLERRAMGAACSLAVRPPYAPGSTWSSPPTRSVGEMRGVARTASGWGFHPLTRTDLRVCQAKYREKAKGFCRYLAQLTQGPARVSLFCARTVARARTPVQAGPFRAPRFAVLFSLHACVQHTARGGRNKRKEISH